MSTNEEFAEQEIEDSVEESIIEQPSTREESFQVLKIPFFLKDESEEEFDFNVEIVDDRPLQDQKSPRTDDQKTKDQFELEDEINNVDDRVKTYR